MVETMTLRGMELKVMAIVTIVALVSSQCVVYSDAAIYNVDWSPYTDIQAWADDESFYPNDSLVFKYEKYNVLEVTQYAFVNCLITNPVSEYNNGLTMIKLSKPGTRFFMSGGPENCLIKLSIDVFSLPD